MSYKFKQKIGIILQYIFLSIVAFICLFPFYWILVGTTNTSMDIVQGRLLPGNNFRNNLYSLTQVTSNVTSIYRSFFNTSKITFITVGLSVLFTSMAGYGFAKFSCKAKNIVFKVILFFMMIPFSAIMIPLFQLSIRTGLIDTHLGVILPAISPIFLIFFFRQSFSTIPNEIIEAARIDGAKEFRIFFRIIMPSMKSTYAAAGIWAFMNQWNSYLWPLLVLQSSEQRTLTLLISSMGSAYFIDYGPLMLAISIATIPVMIIFLLLQKHFVAGMVGSNK